MSNIFKPGNCENYLYEAFQQKLAENKSLIKNDIDKITEAADLLNRVAEVFDDVGLFTESEVITRMLERIASKNINKTSQLNYLSKDDLDFYEGLAPHHKKKLNETVYQHPFTKEIKNVDKFTDALKQMRINQMISDELQNRRSEQPEVLEFESLINPLKHEDGDIIEFETFDKKKL